MLLKTRERLFDDYAIKNKGTIIRCTMLITKETDLVYTVTVVINRIDDMLIDVFVVTVKLVCRRKVISANATTGLTLCSDNKLQLTLGV